MCKVNKITTWDVNSRWLNRKLKNFPQCGVRFGTEDGHGYVLISPTVKVADLEMVSQKIAAAKIKSDKSVSVLILPMRVAKARKIFIPTLRDIVLPPVMSVA